MQTEIDTKTEYSSKNLDSEIESNCLLIAEKNFLPEKYFSYQKVPEIHSYMEDLLTQSFQEESISAVIINARYFLKNGNHRQLIHAYVENNFPFAESFTRGSKEFIIISRKNQFHDFLLSIEPTELAAALDRVYLKLTRASIETRVQEEERKSRQLDENSDNEEEEKSPELPVIQKIDIMKIMATGFVLKLPTIDMDKIIERNRDRIRAFRKRFSELKIEYIILVLDHETNKYYEKTSSTVNIIEITDLNPATGYYFTVKIKLGDFYSESSKAYPVFTESGKEINHTYYAFGDNNLNCLLVNKENMNKTKLKLCGNDDGT